MRVKMQRRAGGARRAAAALLTYLVIPAHLTRAATCSSDSNCASISPPNAYKCVNNICVLKPGAGSGAVCVDPSQCPSGEQCVNNVCVNSSSGAALPTWAIVAIAAGGAVLVALLAAGICFRNQWLCFRPRRKKAALEKAGRHDEARLPPLPVTMANQAPAAAAFTQSRSTRASTPDTLVGASEIPDEAPALAKGASSSLRRPDSYPESLSSSPRMRGSTASTAASDMLASVLDAQKWSFGDASIHSGSPAASLSAAPAAASPAVSVYSREGAFTPVSPNAVRPDGPMLVPLSYQVSPGQLVAYQPVSIAVPRHDVGDYMAPYPSTLPHPHYYNSFDQSVQLERNMDRFRRAFR